MFLLCSTDIKSCFARARGGQSAAAAPATVDNPAVPGEACTTVNDKVVRKRFIGSRFKVAHSALMARWAAIKWDKQAQYRQNGEVLGALEALLHAVCPAAADARAAFQALTVHGSKYSVVKLGESTEQFAIRLWTSAYRVAGLNREVCSIMNDVLRRDRELHEDEAKRDKHDREFASATKLVCTMQYFLNGARRQELFQRAWPMGPDVALDQGRSTEKNTVYRGVGLPVDFLPDPAQHLAFFVKLKEHGGRYRCPMMLATSFQKHVALGFMDRTKPKWPKVLFTVRLRDRDEIGGGCKHANFIHANATAVAGEDEFLFSAYSAFRVLSVVASSGDPTQTNKPHQIFLEACADNQLVPEDVPTAPWH